MLVYRNSTVHRRSEDLAMCHDSLFITGNMIQIQKKYHLIIASMWNYICRITGNSSCNIFSFYCNDIIFYDFSS